MMLYIYFVLILFLFFLFLVQCGKFSYLLAFLSTKIIGYHILNPFNGLFSMTTWQGRTILDFNEARDDVVAATSARKYANHLHFTPESYHSFGYHIVLRKQLTDLQWQLVRDRPGRADSGAPGYQWLCCMDCPLSCWYCCRAASSIRRRRASCCYQSQPSAVSSRLTFTTDNAAVYFSQHSVHSHTYHSTLWQLTYMKLQARTFFTVDFVAM